MDRPRISPVALFLLGMMSALAAWLLAPSEIWVLCAAASVLLIARAAIDFWKNGPDA
jgi:tryptophan-rich sensory protein